MSTHQVDTAPDTLLSMQNEKIVSATQQEDAIFASLPESARIFYQERSNQTFSELVHKLTCCESLWRNVNLLRLYPCCCAQYLNSNQVVGAIVNGEHRLYQGPGFHWVVGITDRMLEKQEIGEDISFGPIKVIFVRAGTLKFASLRNTGKPILLGPGMHYFNDINLMIGSEIDMNFHGNNQMIQCDDRGAFQFVFVKTGSAAIVILRDGRLNVFEPGLHFLQAPDALKTFVSVQQEHFKFGTVDSQQCFLTADNIELHINATIFYRVVDVVTLFTTRIKDEKDLLETLHSQAMATLLTIIRSETFQGIGKRQQIKTMNKELSSDFGFNAGSSAAAGGGGGGGGGDDLPLATAEPFLPSAPPAGGRSAEAALESITMGFQNIIHDAEPSFKRMMQSNFASSGIEIQSLRIEQIEFADKTMQKQVSEFAMTNTKLQSQQQTISAQRAIQVAEAERDSATLLIKKKAEADANVLTTDAANMIKTKTARADAEARLIMAEAEAQSLLKIGNAELEIQEKQNTMPNAQLRIFTEAQKAVMQNVSKVIYTDQQSMLLKPYLAMPDGLVKDD